MNESLDRAAIKAQAPDIRSIVMKDRREDFRPGELGYVLLAALEEAEDRIAAVLILVEELEADIPADPSNEVAHHIAKVFRAALHPVAETPERTDA